MSLDNLQIDNHVRVAVGALLKDVKVKDSDRALIIAGTELIINVLQNLNDIAWASMVENNRG